MEYKRLGEISISRLAFGCEPLGGTDWGKVDVNRIADAIHQAVDAGINFFDTAAIYGLGESERRLAKILGQRRTELAICSKIGLRWSQESSLSRARVWVDNSHQTLFSALAASLERLQVECLPILFIHAPDPKVPPQVLAESICEIQRKGMAANVGLSNFSLTELRAVHSLVNIPIVQVLYNPADVSPERFDYLNFCQKNGIVVSAYGVLNRGLLSGKYSPQSIFSDTDRRSRLPDFQGEECGRRMRILSQITEVAGEIGASVPQVAIAWALHTQGLSAAIMGIKTTQQLSDNLAALNVKLSQEQYDRITDSGACDIKVSGKAS